MSQPQTLNLRQRRRRRALTPWELPQLLRPLYAYRPGRPRKILDRPYFASIVNFIYRNRFAVSSQVQRRLASQLPSDRTARRRLAEMQTLGYIGVAPTCSTSPLWPKVFFATGKGIQKLRHSLAAQGLSWKPSVADRSSRYKVEGFSSDKVLHGVLTTEFMLAVWQSVSARPDLELLTTQRRALAQHPAFQVTLGGKAKCMVPDGMFLFRQHGGGMMASFVELDTGKMNRKQMLAKLRRYEAWMRSDIGQRYLLALYTEHGAKNPRPTCRVLFVCDDRESTGGLNRAAELVELAITFPNSLLDTLGFATVADLRAHQHDAVPLGASVWRRGKDVRKGDPVATPSPLYLRLYFQPHLTELARLIGYDGMPVPATQKRLQELIDIYGKEKMVEAANELVHVDETKNPPVARLKDEVRKLAWQLLGPPPEHPWAVKNADKPQPEGRGAKPKRARKLRPPKVKP